MGSKKLIQEREKVTKKRRRRYKVIACDGVRPAEELEFSEDVLRETMENSFFNGIMASAAIEDEEFSSEERDAIRADLPKIPEKLLTTKK